MKRKSVLFMAFSLLLSLSVYSNKNQQTTKGKELTFTEVEKKLHFAKPLTEAGKKAILKKYGSAQAYYDSICTRRANPNKPKGVILGVANPNDSALNAQIESARTKGYKVYIKKSDCDKRSIQKRIEDAKAKDI